MNADTIEQLLIELRAIDSALLMACEHVRAGLSFDADIARDVEYARALIAGLAHKLDALNLQHARARAMTHNGVEERLTRGDPMAGMSG